MNGLHCNRATQHAKSAASCTVPATLLLLLLLIHTAAAAAPALVVRHDAALDGVVARIPLVGNASTSASVSPWSGSSLGDSTLYVADFGGHSSLKAAVLSGQLVGGVVGVEPICLAYNVNNATVKLAVSVQGVEALLTSGGGVVYEVGVSGAAPTAFASGASFTVLLPDTAGNGIAQAFLLSAGAAGASAFSGLTGYPASVTSNGAVSVVADTAAVAAGVASTTFTIGVVGLLAARAAGLPCLRILHGPSATAVYTAAMNRDAAALYVIDQSALTVRTTTPTAACYPLVGPVVAYINRSLSCQDTTTNQQTLVALIDRIATDAAEVAFLKSQLLRLDTSAVYAFVKRVRQQLCSPVTWVAAGGSSALEPVLLPWLLHYQESASYNAGAKRDFFTNYLPSGSGYGLSASVSGAVVFGGSEVPLGPTELASKPSLMNVPVAALSVALVFNWAQTCVVLNLPRCVLPLIFNGSVTRWDDARIAESNSLLTLPAEAIEVVVRQGASGSTSVLTSGLAALEVACGFSSRTFYASDTWVFGNHVTRISGTSGMSSYVRSTPYTLGYIVHPTAVADGHQQARVLDQDTQTTTTATVSAAAKGSTATVDPSSLVISFSTDATLYPFIGVAYAILDSNRVGNCSEQKYAADFLMWVLQDPANVAMTARLDYIPISGGMVVGIVAAMRHRLHCGGRPLYPVDVASGNALTVVLAAVIPSVVVVVGGAWLLWALVLRGSGGRNNAAAPTDASRPVTIAFTDIQASTTLWATVPTIMAGALDRHNRIVRACLAKNKGYEIKTIGDAFMVAFSSPADAVRFALDAQQALYDTDWETDEIDAVYEEMTAEGKDGIPYLRELWRGLRVRIGIHCGLCDIHLDPNSGGYDYHGNVVNTAARVEDAGHGGQIVVTQDVLDALREGGHDQLLDEALVVKPIGPTSLRGLPSPILLHQVHGPNFGARQFPALRVEKESGLLEDDDSTETGTSYTAESVHTTAMLAKVFPVASTLDVLFSTMKPKDLLPILRSISKCWGLHVSKHIQDNDVYLRKLSIRTSEVLAARSEQALRRRSSGVVIGGGAPADM